MRLSTQLVAGHAFLILSLILLTGFSIGLAERLTRAGDQLLEKRLLLLGSAHEMQALLLRSEIEKLGGPKLPAGARVGFEELARRAAAAASPGKAETLAGILADIGPGQLSGARASDEASVAAGELAVIALGDLRGGAERAARMGRSGIGLLALLSGLTLIVALYFGYWLSRSILQPLERMSRALDAVTAGDLGRRFTEAGPSSALTEIAASLNQLVDRLHRSEATPRTDLLLACGALEEMLSTDGRASGVLAHGHRLIASNDRARQLVLERGAPFHWIAMDARKNNADSVETRVVGSAGGQPLGELVRISDAGAS